MEIIFVYGLFRDQARKMLGEDAKFVSRASIDGTMYRVNEFYPGVVLNKKSKVWGDVFEINPDILPNLDKWEGEEYKRIKVKSSIGRECWAWIWNKDTDGFNTIDTGDWYLR